MQIANKEESGAQKAHPPRALSCGHLPLPVESVKMTLTDSLTLAPVVATVTRDPNSDVATFTGLLSTPECAPYFHGLG